MELRIRDVAKTCPNGVQVLKQVNLTIPCGMMAGHIGRRREQPEPAVAP